MPNVSLAARRCEQFGADGITVHPRPDERHITYRDVETLKPLVQTEFNVEGYPSDNFMELVLATKPHQVTLVPDLPGVLTSNAGWDTVGEKGLLQDVIGKLKEAGIRTSIFVDTDLYHMEGALACGTDRVELYTESYAVGYVQDREQAVAPFVAAGKLARELGLGLNAGHDLNLDNLAFFAEQMPKILEVSIGHALISDALYLGLENTIQLYKRQLQ